MGFTSWDEALAEASRCLNCPDPTCVRGCPAHNDIPSFIRAVRDRDLTAAHDVLRRTSFLPDVCARVCGQPAQCEGACTCSPAAGDPVAIAKLERFVTDSAPVPPPRRHGAAGAGLSVAVVGSGPAGIAAAWHLTEAGAQVTVYERDRLPGGLIAWGIPDFTLPAPVAARPWQQLTAAGVTLRCGRPIAPWEIGHLLGEHDGVILAHGAPVLLRPPVPGADLSGVTDATAFLKAGKAALASGDTGRLPRALGLAGQPGRGGESGAPRVLVLGAGHSALDVARTARRLGLRAVCVDGADEKFALPCPGELAEARREGVEFRFLRTVARLDGTFGQLRRAVLMPTRQPRAGRPPRPARGQPEVLDTDLAVMAMGYRTDPAFADQAFQERVWAAGDAIAGPSTVAEAMAEGRRAADSLLAARPARGPSRAPRQVLVAYDSGSGRTARAAQVIARELRATGAVVRAAPLAEVDRAELTCADLLVAGTRAARSLTGRARLPRATRAWLAGLPRLPGLRTAAFCTYAFSPGATPGEMHRALAGRGMVILAERAFAPGGDGDAAAARFARGLRATAWPARRV